MSYSGLKWFKYPDADKEQGRNSLDRWTGGQTRRQSETDKLTYKQRDDETDERGDRWTDR